ncbi:hypothetical protein L3Q82_017152, partial [Scortum barcoo]
TLTVPMTSFQASPFPRLGYIPTQAQRGKPWINIEASLKSGIIPPSSLPAGAGFLFVGQLAASHKLEEGPTIHGFCKLLHKFIRNFSAVAVPLDALTSDKTVSQWNPWVEEAFQCQKKLFTSAPILTFPDP